MVNMFDVTKIELLDKEVFRAALILLNARYINVITRIMLDRVIDSCKY